MKKKLLIILLIILIVIGALGAAAYFVLGGKSEKSEAKRSIDEIVASSVDVAEITTNLKSDNIIRLAIKLETDSDKSKEELEKRDFQVKDAVISLLADTNADEIEGDKGKETFKKELKDKVNSYLQEGKVEKVYITSFNLQ
ncbi:flagellar basal body-associated protein FliL [Bacillus halotolerans]|jgi:flagellar FliL protein|uniref:Flagellar protein FliL n=2 Tax=Bacillus mojavensis subgroup TaxID=653388 RepID=A0AAP3CRY9_BACMO|nr:MULTISPECIES: flagellar basal body-associated protein FliL [Bacillus]MBV7320642.1 flagellar basal body-associated protein FliL [Halalkalibacterium halodurans]AZV47748.1 flagellar basal body-associated protein FliL [Bacillus halotolerans]MBU5246183.1 flagellar basal body-associated protein FliL [Bacillus halotolerans]MCM3353037.1 flagellar basal body-associated protein FliL [Bacillus halotolerans]MCP9299703.1 flagellar basal body-associated protein FliL [Bacillus halotolerans]